MLGPLIISHRACQGHAPENTLAGIRAAIALGVDAIEIDVQVSRDGVPVLMHDEALDRTTNGTGRVSDLSLDELRTLDAGTGFEHRFAGEPIPTLEEVLDLTRNACLLVIEIKQQGIERNVADAVHRLDAADGSMIWSFHADVVQAARQVLPEVPTARLWSGRSGDVTSLLADTVQKGAQAVSVHHVAVSEALVHEARLRGLAVYTWTPDTPNDQRRVAGCGVAGICSNLPDVLASTLSDARFARAMHTR